MKFQKGDLIISHSKNNPKNIFYDLILEDKTTIVQGTIGKLTCKKILRINMYKNKTIVSTVNVGINWLKEFFKKDKNNHVNSCKLIYSNRQKQ